MNSHEKIGPGLGAVRIFPGRPPLGAAAALPVEVSPVKALTNLNKAVCQFFGINLEFRLLGLSPNSPQEPYSLVVERR